MTHPQRRFAAQVVLASAPLTPEAATAQQLAGTPPQAEAAQQAAQAFGALGYQVGPTIGHSFSIEGDAKLFERTFGVALLYAPDGSVCEGGAGGARVEALSLAALSPALQAIVRQVLFAAPPAFGPGTLP